MRLACFELLYMNASRNPVWNMVWRKNKWKRNSAAVRTSYYCSKFVDIKPTKTQYMGMLWKIKIVKALSLFYAKIIMKIMIDIQVILFQRISTVIHIGCIFVSIHKTTTSFQILHSQHCRKTRCKYTFIDLWKNLLSCTTFNTINWKCHFIQCEMRLDWSQSVVEKMTLSHSTSLMAL